MARLGRETHRCCDDYPRCSSFAVRIERTRYVRRLRNRPDGVLVRPAEHAASTYTKPELPDEAKENSEKGAEAAARHYLDLIVYAWNTGDTQPLADMSAPTSEVCFDVH